MLEPWLILIYLYLTGFVAMSFYGIGYNHIKKPWHLWICLFSWYIIAGLFGAAMLFIAGKHVEDKIKDVILK